MKRFIIAAHALQALTILAAMYVVFVPILIIVAVTLNFDEIDIGIAVVRVGESTTWWHAILSFIPNAIVAFGLLNLTRFGNFIAQGIRFTKSVTSCLQRASILFIVGVLLSWVIEPLITTRSYLEAFQELLQNHGLLLIISIAFSLVATLLKEAKAIEDENREFY